MPIARTHNKLWNELIIATSIKLDDTDGSNYLELDWNEDDSSDRTLYFKVNSGNRTIDLSGDLTLSGANKVASWEATTAVISPSVYASGASLKLQDDAAQNITMFASAGAGENPLLYIYGDKSGSAKYGYLTVDTLGDFKIYAEQDLKLYGVLRQEFYYGSSPVLKAYLDSAFNFDCTVVMKDNEYLIYGDNSDVGMKYDEATNDGFIWGIPVASKRGVIICEYSDITANFTSLIGTISEPTIHLLDLDVDSYIKFHHAADDNPEIVLYSGVSSGGSYIRQSNAEGIASSTDLRIGLDASSRNLVISDITDIAVDHGMTASGDPKLWIYRLGVAGQYASLYYGGITFETTLAMVTSRAMEFYNSYSIEAGHAYKFYTGSGKELRDADGEQAYIALYPKIKQTSTAAYIGILLDVTETTLGDGSAGEGYNAFADFRIDGVPCYNLCREKVAKAHNSDLFDASATSDSANIWAQPANTLLIGVFYRLDTQFAGGSISDVDVTLGLAGDNDGLLAPAAHNLTSDTVGTIYSKRGDYWNNVDSGGYYAASATTWVAYASSVGDDLDQTSAGQITFYFVYYDFQGT